MSRISSSPAIRSRSSRTEPSRTCRSNRTSRSRCRWRTRTRSGRDHVWTSIGFMIEFKRSLLHPITTPLCRRRVLAVVSDLFFSVKITDAAKRTGLHWSLSRIPGEVLEKAKAKPFADHFRFELRRGQSAASDRRIKGQGGNQRHQPDRISFAYTGRSEAAGAGSGMRHGAGAFSVLAKYVADFQTALRA